MKRIAKSILGLVCLLGMMVGASTVAAEEYHEGFEYLKIVPAQPTQVAKGKVEVVEVFWYGCGFCNAFEPYLQKWLKNKPKNVEFFRIPAQFNQGWTIHARAYYAAVLLKKDQKFHQAMFHEIHQKRNALDTRAKLQKFFAKHKVSKEQFDQAFDHFSVKTKLKRAKSIVKKYGVSGVPAMIVNGKYLTGTTRAGSSYGDMLKVINFLVEKESKGG
jgi:thiol:disulfide interchange protein DsbA